MAFISPTLMRTVRGVRLTVQGTGVARSMSTSAYTGWNPETGHRVKRKVHDAHVPFPSFLAQPKVAAVIGAPMTHGQPKEGTDDGPDMIRNAGLHDELKSLGWKVDDLGNLAMPKPTPSDAPWKGPGMARHPVAVGKGCEIVMHSVKKATQENKFVLTLGGDHSIGAGTVAGILQARPETGIVWVDAHADINTPSISESGNMHGMPLALVMGLDKPHQIPGWEWLEGTPVLSPRQLVYIGLRDVDEAERKILRDLGILCFTMYHVDKYGIGGVMERILEHLQHRPLHLSYDIDAVDPLHAPATGTTVRGGLTFREAHYVAEAVGESGLLGSLDMVEVNPSLGSDADTKDTVEMGLALISSAMGSRIV
eukprot:CAMPEP_0173390472 /NCGR_PEP_ID=MMETSP1356-20130122/14969_1 /TAXON_ID=77927 ORGANISM="Hemiselmis virescens, Strain PCC157" /NCGR_SAMPLE_ID=MMETSP1356 /ASSEMBLY_ACC=CAM_ASM_000847 /LENGTH=366 /DNA_ID=CAMNT_0014347873 /DNA_START=26 /DNA_END=1126 /DNA_ORIENTATION=+